MMWSDIAESVGGQEAGGEVPVSAVIDSTTTPHGRIPACDAGPPQPDAQRHPVCPLTREEMCQAGLEPAP